MHNATITAVKKVRNRGFEKATFYNFLRERTATMKSFKSVCVTGGSDSAMRWSESTILFFWRAFLYARRIFGLWHHGKGEMMGGALERIPQVGVKQGLLPWQLRLFQTVCLEKSELLRSGNRNAICFYKLLDLPLGEPRHTFTDKLCGDLTSFAVGSCADCCRWAL